MSNMDYKETSCYTCPICDNNLKYKEVRYDGSSVAQLRILCSCCGLQIVGKTTYSNRIWKMVSGGRR